MVSPTPFPDRTFGVLLHPSSLAGRDDIGTVGDDAVTFVRWLASAGAGLWQILPLTINGKDDSPYFSASAFAGNVWLIDLDGLHTVGLLDEPDRPAGAPGPVPFDAVSARKRPLLWSAADRFLALPEHPWRSAYDRFVASSDWLAGTAHYFALKDHHPGTSWWDWPAPVRRCEPGALAASRRELADEIARWQAVLFFFDHQWAAVKAAANASGVRIVGDIPIYVAPDSADVWLHRRQFHVDDAGTLAVQAGVPPDYFSETGQLWGNPLYRWDVMEADGFAWWISRLRRAGELGDVVRIDHFRALSAYWEVAGTATDARRGRWAPGPGQRFVDAVRAALPDLALVAEDLGMLDDDVIHLRDDNELFGMRVLQFGFDGDPDNPNHPANLPERCVVYTGTHDNDTTAGWWRNLGVRDRRRIRESLGLPSRATGRQVAWAMIDLAFGSPAIAAVVPFQDLLALGSEARMNVPSTTSGNWGWRLPAGALRADVATRLRSVAERSGR